MTSVREPSLQLGPPPAVVLGWEGVKGTCLQNNTERLRAGGKSPGSEQGRPHRGDAKAPEPRMPQVLLTDWVPWSREGRSPQPALGGPVHPRHQQTPPISGAALSLGPSALSTLKGGTWKRGHQRLLPPTRRRAVGNAASPPRALCSLLTEDAGEAGPGACPQTLQPGQLLPLRLPWVTYPGARDTDERKCFWFQGDHAQPGGGGPPH